MTLLKNVGIDIGQLAPGDRQFVHMDLAGHANRGFHDRPDQAELPRGWFAGGRDDMRYFPVNRRGIDPVHNVPAPVEPFPEQPSDDGSQASSPITAGVEVNGYQHYDGLRRGRMGWTGDNPQRSGVVLYVWNVTNPHPDRRVEQLRLATQHSTGLALVGLTLEQSGSVE